MTWLAELRSVCKQELCHLQWGAYQGSYEFSQQSNYECRSWALSQNCEKRLPASSCLSVYLFVRPSVYPQRTRLSLAAISWSLCTRICRKSVHKIQISFKCNNEFDWRHPDVWKFNTKVIKYSSSNTSCFIVCEATCFGPYMTFIRPICESS